MVTYAKVFYKKGMFIMGKIVIVSNLSRKLPGWKEAIEMINKEGHIIVDPGENAYTMELIKEHLVDADALIVGLNKIDAQIIKESKQLKVIAKPGVGVDNIDIKFAKERGILVCNTPGSNADSVADHLFALILSVVRKITSLDAKMRMGDGWKDYPILGNEIANKVFGVVGTGSIGKKAVQRAKGFGMSVLAYDIIKDLKWAKDNCVEYVDLDKLLACADIISLHLPLNEKTKGIISTAQFDLMKKTSYIFNTSRGYVIDENALITALKKGKIAGAGIDVFDQEPLLQSVLFKFENVVLTPHVGGFSREASIRSRIMTAENIINALNGEKLEL